MANEMNKSYDYWQVGNKTYLKTADIGDKAWEKISESSPGQEVNFFNVLGSKLSSESPKVNVNK